MGVQTHTSQLKVNHKSKAGSNILLFQRISTLKFKKWHTDSRLAIAQAIIECITGATGPDHLLGELADACEDWGGAGARPPAYALSPAASPPLLGPSHMGQHLLFCQHHQMDRSSPCRPCPRGILARAWSIWAPLSECRRHLSPLSCASRKLRTGVRVWMSDATREKEMDADLRRRCYWARWG
jgi:hypothetical protein